MTSARTWTAAALVPLAAGAFLALGGRGAREACAAVPPGPPSFSNPKVFTNEFFPFEVGAFRKFRGRSDGVPTGSLDEFLADTRTFTWNGKKVACRVLRETATEDGEVIEVTENYFAQADDGSVYYFGEVVDDYEGGILTGHGGSWLVGGPTGGDPAEAGSVDDPALFLPAEPEVGDTWMPEDVPDGPQELDRLVREDLRVKTPEGTFEDCIEILETNPVDGATETKWYAPGIGVCRGKGHRETFALVDTTYEASDD